MIKKLRSDGLWSSGLYSPSHAGYETPLSQTYDCAFRLVIILEEGDQVVVQCLGRDIGLTIVEIMRWNLCRQMRRDKVYIHYTIGRSV